MPLPLLAPRTTAVYGSGIHVCNNRRFGGIVGGYGRCENLPLLFGGDHPAKLGRLPIIVVSNYAGLVVQFEDRINQRADDAKLVQARSITFFARSVDDKSTDRHDRRVPPLTDRFVITPVDHLRCDIELAVPKEIPSGIVRSGTAG